MHLHRNAKLGLAGRFSLVDAIESGLSIREAARRHGVSPATACTWWHRWRDASSEEQLTLGCLLDRSSRPRCCSRMLPAVEQDRICEARRKTGWGPRQLAARLGHPHVFAERLPYCRRFTRSTSRREEPPAELSLRSRSAHAAGDAGSSSRWNGALAFR